MCIVTRILTSALGAVERSASRLGCFFLGKKGPVTHLIGVWVGPRAVSDSVVKTDPAPSGKRNLVI